MSVISIWELKKSHRQLLMRRRGKRLQIDFPFEDKAAEALLGNLPSRTAARHTLGYRAGDKRPSITFHAQMFRYMHSNEKCELFLSVCSHGAALTRSPSICCCKRESSFRHLCGLVGEKNGANRALNLQSHTTCKSDFSMHGNRGISASEVQSRFTSSLIRVQWVVNYL